MAQNFAYTVSSSNELNIKNNDKDGEPNDGELFNENSKLSPIIKRVEGDIPIRHLLPSGIYHG